MRAGNYCFAVNVTKEIQIDAVTSHDFDDIALKLNKFHQIMALSFINSIFILSLFSNCLTAFCFITLKECFIYY